MSALVQAVGAMFESVNDGTAIWPTHVTYDLGLLFVETAELVEGELVTPTDWNLITNFPRHDTAGCGLYIFWKRAASAAEANVTISDPGNHVGGCIITVRGALRTGTPIDQSASTTKSILDTSISIPGVNATEGGNDVFYVHAGGTGTVGPPDTPFGDVVGTNANLVSVTNLFGRTWLSGNDGSLGIWTGVLAAAGASGTLTATGTASFRGPRGSFSLLAEPSSGPIFRGWYD